MTAADRLRHVLLKAERAREHLAALTTEVQAFLDGSPYGIAAKRDEQTKRLIYYVTTVTPIPDRLAVIAGDVLQNLMSTLDHLAYQLVCKDANDEPPNARWIYFPIADDAATYGSKKHGKMAGALPATIELIDKLAPYKGGNDALWRLYRLNNVEKHRLLLTVGSQAAGIHLGQMVAPLLRQTFPEDAVAAIESMDLYVNPADTGFPLKPGFELLHASPDEEPNPKLRFRFQVVLDEPGIVAGGALLPTLRGLADAVDAAVSGLAPRLH